ncbi:uncharacterized protein LOC129739045 [Uranotaenia lowii]|uniref:uncharacterized protein LOC129739045 n=1 Tax=Uranotaenia lowii TaxID=190385 RepID=UPI0024787D00|nr:uncharacterized protein LOC129739045 [Uranotaenia lowii]
MEQDSSIEEFQPLQQHINHFPNEVLDHIFAFLALPDRKSVSLVCHRWNKVAFAPHYMRKIELRLISCDPAFDGGRFEALKQTERIYRNILAFHVHSLISPDLMKLLFEVLSFLGGNLESFYCLNHVGKRELRQILQLAPNLKQLIARVQEDETYTEPMPVMEHLVDFAALSQVLHKKGLEIESMFPKLSKMSTHFVKCTDYSRAVEAFQHFGPQLQSLEISADNNLLPLDQLRFPQLEAIHMSGKMCLSIDNYTLKSFFGQFNNLSEAFIDCAVQDNILEVITKTCSKLRVLHIAVDSLRGPGFASLGQLPNLKTLSIGGLLRQDMLKECPKPITTVLNLDIRIYKQTTSTEDFFLLQKVLPNIRDIRVHYVDCANPNMTLSKLIRSFPKLKRLEIQVQCRSQKVQRARALKALASVEELIINGIDVAINDIPESSQLKRLYIFYLNSSNDDGILRLVRRLPALRFLELGWCRGITEHGVHQIRREFPQCVVHLMANR